MLMTPKRAPRKKTQEESLQAETSQALSTKTAQESRHDVLDMLLKSDIGNHNFFPEEPVHYEGQLAIDMVETGNELIVVSTIAGADTKSLSISVHGDVLTIRGKREAPTHASAQEYLYKECYWGWFSRTIVLPVDVDQDGAHAEFRSGVLVIRLPKQIKLHEVPIHIVEE